MIILPYKLAPRVNSKITLQTLAIHCLIASSNHQKNLVKTQCWQLSHLLRNSDHSSQGILTFPKMSLGKRRWKRRFICNRNQLLPYHNHHNHSNIILLLLNRKYQWINRTSPLKSLFMVWRTASMMRWVVYKINQCYLYHLLSLKATTEQWLQILIMILVLWSYCTWQKKSWKWLGILKITYPTAIVIRKVNELRTWEHVWIH